MSKAIITEQHLHDIADAIIAKGGATGAMTPAQMPGAIANIPSGGGEWTFRPWIMSESDPTKLDGWIHLWFHFDDDIATIAYFSAQYISDGHTFEVDWGDGTVETIAASSAYTTRVLSHTYAEKGDYRVDITGYDSANFNQYMFCENTDYNLCSALGVRQAQFGTFDTETGISSSIKGYGLRYITWDDFAPSNNYYLFRGYPWLVSVGDLSAVTELKLESFRNCLSLVSIGDMPNLTTITGSNCFYGCKSLVSVGNIPNLTSVSGNLFGKCTSLKTVGDLSSLPEIPSGIFSGCSSLETIGDMSGATSIGNIPFDGCTSLKSLTFRTRMHTEVEGITYFDRFPNLGKQCVFHCSDGDFYRSGNSLLPVEA